jgi:dipeptidyl aminopeptidase/acylaminoacyl peptidase
MDDRVRSTFFLLLSVSAAAAQPLPEGAVARVATTPDESPFTGYVCAALAPDGKTVAVADEAGRLDLWDLSGKRLRTLTKDGPRGAAPCWSPDGRRLFSAHDRGIAIWDVATAGGPRVLPSHLESSAAPQIVVSPDGRSVVAGWSFPMIVCWDVETGAERWRSHSGGGLAVTPGGSHVARGWFGQRFDLLDVATGKEVGRLGPDLLACKPLCSDRFALSRDGRTLAAWAERGVVVLRDARTGEERRRLDTGQGFGAALAFSPDGHWLATGGSDHALMVWEVDTCQVVCRRPGHARSVTTIDFAPDGRRVLTASGDLTALLWDLAPPARTVADPWADLNSNNGLPAYTAVWALARDPSGPALLRAKLPPAPRLDAAELDRLLAALDADRHAVRERAMRALAGRGRSVLPALQAALGRARSAEAGARLEKLIRAVPTDLTPEEVAHRRAVKAMALSGTPAASELLSEWANGAPGAVLTDEAQAALRRLRAPPPG